MQLISQHSIFIFLLLLGFLILIQIFGFGNDQGFQRPLFHAIDCDLYMNRVFNAFDSTPIDIYFFPFRRWAAAIS